MATVQELHGHRRQCLRDGVSAVVGGLLLATLPLAGLASGLVGTPTVGTALATLAALAGLVGTLALAVRYHDGFGVVGWVGSAVLAVGFLTLAVGGATDSLDLLGQTRPGGGLLAVVGYFLVLVGSVPFGLGLWQAGGSLGAAATFVLSMPVGYALGLGVQQFALPNVTAAFVGFGLPVAGGFVLAGVAVLLEPAPGCEDRV